MADSRIAHPDYGEDADELTLDYMIHDTAAALFTAFRNRNARGAQRYGDSFGLKLSMLDTFIAMFKHNRGGLRFNSNLCENLDTKVRLLQIIIALASPLLTNSPYSGGVNPEGILPRNPHSHARRRSSVNLSPQDIYGAIPFSWVLPEFLLLSAMASDILHQYPSPQWMQMAAEFMVHDVIARFQAEGAAFDSESACKESFAWCYIPEDEADFEPRHREAIENQLRRLRSYPSIQSEIWIINKMFHIKTEDGSEESASQARTPEISSWQAIRQTNFTNTLQLFSSRSLPSQERSGQETAQASTPNTTTSLDWRSLASQYPLPPFIELVLQFCESMLPLLGIPILLQLESGTLESEGLTAEETRELVRKLRLR